MSDAKFTKGEWSVWSERVGIIDRSDSQANGMMREVAYIEKYDFPDEYIANAHLVATAPEMYEMLNRWVNSVECVADNYQEGLKEETMDLLAKARGES